MKPAPMVKVELIGTHQLRAAELEQLARETERVLRAWPGSVEYSQRERKPDAAS